MDNIRLERIQQFINALGEIGRGASGGITRLSYSEEFRQAQRLVQSYMEQAGMEVMTDPVGNLIGTCAGTDGQLPPVMTGSHLDTVPDGGAFDGALGIATAIECVRSWQEAGWRPRRTVQVIATVEEEGTLFGLGCLGSRALVGEFSPDSELTISDSQGHSLAQLLANMGLPAGPFCRVDDKYKQLRAFIELHVEQGAELEKAGLPAGMVSAIVGIDRLGVSIRGKANHAGATRMENRQDALVAAAAIISRVYDQAAAANGKYVATVGKLDVRPNAENVVPGEVNLTVEIRAEYSSVLEETRADLLRSLKEIEARYKVVTEITKHHQIPPVQLDGDIIARIGSAAGQLGIPCRTLPSWAGHDAMVLAKFVPVGMIFVPSIGGISHSPAEASDWDCILKACRILEHTLRGLATD